MSLGAALGLAVLVVVTMFVLVFVMAGVETIAKFRPIGEPWIKGPTLPPPTR